MPAIIPLGQIVGTLGSQMLPQVLDYLNRNAAPVMKEILADPAGYLTRIGDLLVWNFGDGKSRKIIAGIQAIAEKQEAVEIAVESIGKAQLATASALGVLQNISIATLGVSTLTGGVMLWRMNAMNKKLTTLQRTVNRNNQLLTAGLLADLVLAIQSLDACGAGELGERTLYDQADSARNNAARAAATFGPLAAQEAQNKKPDLDLLNFASRCYFLALWAELHGHLLCEDPQPALQTIKNAKAVTKLIAETTFKNTISENPQMFLSQQMKHQGVTLNLLTEAYMQAQRLDAYKATEKIKNASDMFELVRSAGIKGKTILGSLFKSRARAEASKLKYALACFEDIGRVEALGLHAMQPKSTLKAIRTEVEKMRREREQEQGASNLALAYSLPTLTVTV